MDLRVSVIVPSYKRPQQLAECLQGLARQNRPPDEVVVVHRPDDTETRLVLADAPLEVREVHVTDAGVLAALHVGARAAVGEVLAFTDDDAVPREGWLAALLTHFDDPRVGVVGGRDVMSPETDDGPRAASRVGQIGRWGKVYGFHHVGEGRPSRVAVTKGVNMCFRAEALAFPKAMRGGGAQVHNELAACLWAADQGWELVYDPAAVVDHNVGPRFDRDRRHRPDRSAIADEAYNLVHVLLTHRRDLFLRRAAYGLLVGDRASPGLVRGVLALVKRDRTTARRLAPSIRGQSAALRDVALRRYVELVPVRPQSVRNPER